MNPITEKRTNIKNVLSEIHSYCVDKSTSTLWFLYNNISKLSNIKRPNLKYYLNVINQELLISFDDRKKILLYHMKRIIEEQIDLNGKKNVRNYGINSFEYVWEYLVNKVYGNVLIKNYYPTARYNLLGNVEFEASKLRPDTIFKDSDNNLFIIDAKYYKSASNSSFNHMKGKLPCTDSIQKQITYGDFIYKNFKETEMIQNIYNAFVIPYNKINNNLNLSSEIEYIGYASCDWKDISNDKEKYLKISTILIDTKYLIDIYFSKIDEKNRLINCIKMCEED